MSQLEHLQHEASQLSTTEQWKLVRFLLSLLEDNQRADTPSEWHEQLNRLYGALADSPIERPEQPPLEEREWPQP